MKKVVLLVIVFCLAGPALHAEQAPEVLLRYSRHDSNIRLVLESGADMIEKAGIVTSLSGIRIDFPSAFEIRRPADFIFDMTKKERYLTISLKDVSEIKTSRLSSPSRLVFDLRTAASTQRGFLQQIEKKLQGGQQPGQQNQMRTEIPPRRVKTVVIDPGHGGYDYGIISGEAKEKDIDLVLARELSAALTKKGRTVFLTRKSDQSGSLSERIDFALRKNADLFISLHASSTENFAVYTAAVGIPDVDATVKPYDVYATQTKFLQNSRDMADAVGMALKSEFGTAVVLRELPIPVLYAMDAPAVLIEYPLAKSFSGEGSTRARIIAALLNGITYYEK